MRRWMFLIVVCMLLPARAGGAAPDLPYPVVSLSASVSPGSVAPGGIITYSDALTNSGDVAGVDVRLAHTLPAGFSYVSGSARMVSRWYPDRQRRPRHLRKYPGLGRPGGPRATQ